MYIVIFHYDIPPLSYWLQLTDRNFILQGRFIKSFKDSSLKLYRTPGLTRGFLYTKKLRRTGASLSNGASGKIRTRDPRLRRPLLYPTELQTHMDGRDDRIRTCDILLPKQARYQTALHPVDHSYSISIYSLAVNIQSNFF